MTGFKCNKFIFSVKEGPPSFSPQVYVREDFYINAQFSPCSGNIHWFMFLD